MQWLIDIAIEAMKEWYAENGGIINRGPYSASDFTMGDFTKDENWHTLSLASIIPEGVKFVYLTLSYKSYGVYNWAFFCKPSTGTNYNCAHAATIVAGEVHFHEFFVGVDSNREVEYNVANASWTLFNLSVRAWCY